MKPLQFFKKNGESNGQRAQLELAVKREVEADRNFERGGRSFYFFDFDDNIAFLQTSTFVFHKSTGREIRLSTREFAEHSGTIGKSGIYADYEIRYDDNTGSFKHFRDREMSVVEKVLGRKQLFIDDLAHALGYPDFQWKGPSWHCFYHAVFNKRPVSLITARGHHPETIKDGLRLLIREGHIPHEPNYLSLYPINYPAVRQALQKTPTTTVAEMKQAAIAASVEEALRVYGFSPYHRFGMSDDDPKNIELIIEEMTRLKRRYPEMSFFVFDTHKGQHLKREVFEFHTEEQKMTRQEQLTLF
jgi:hypothetical protein